MLGDMSVRELRSIAERQLGLVTSHQLRGCMTVHAVRTAVGRGWLVHVRPHVFRFAGVRPSWPQSVLAAVLAAGDGACASHEAAAAMWSLPDFPATSAIGIHVTVPGDRRPRVGGVTLHRCLVLPDAHRAVIGRVPVTSVERTLCDLAGSVPEPRLGRLVDDALSRRLTTVDELRAAYEALRGGQRPIRAMGRVLAARGDEWAAAESAWEARLVRWLVEAGLPPPVQQYAVDGYRVDLAYPERNVFIEFDGFAVHAPRSRFDRDRHRANVLQLRTGALVLRFTSTSTREEVVRQVTAALRRAA